MIYCIIQKVIVIKLGGIMRVTYEEVILEYKAEQARRQEEWDLVKKLALQLLAESPGHTMDPYELEKQLSEITGSTYQVISNVLIQMLGDELKLDTRVYSLKS